MDFRLEIWNHFFFLCFHETTSFREELEKEVFLLLMFPRVRRIFREEMRFGIELFQWTFLRWTSSRQSMNGLLDPCEVLFFRDKWWDSELGSFDELLWDELLRDELFWDKMWTGFVLRFWDEFSMERCDFRGLEVSVWQTFSSRSSSSRILRNDL